MDILNIAKDDNTDNQFDEFNEIDEIDDQIDDEISNIYSLSELHNYVKSHPNQKNLIIFFDLDDTLINPDNETVLEIKESRALIKFLQKNQIPSWFITGRYYDTICDPRKRDLKDMEHNVHHTIFPLLNKIGIDITNYNNKREREKFAEIKNEKNKCIGLFYMGIFFSGDKGATMKSILNMTQNQHKEVIFIDDYEPYIKEVKKNLPTATIFRRVPPY